MDSRLRGNNGNRYFRRPQPFAPERLPNAHCITFSANRITNETSSINNATADAPCTSNCSSLPVIISGRISETIGILPAIKITEPYSPVARANIIPAPVKSAGVISGSSTRRNVVKRFAPKVAAASSYSPDNSSNTGCTARTIKGRLTTTSAIQMPTGVNAI